MIEFKHSADISFKDYNVNQGTTTFTAKIETLDGATVLGDSSVDATLPLMYTKDTTVRATFTGDFTSHPDYPFDMYGILELDIREVGGQEYIKQISTEVDELSDYWKGAVSVNKASITVNTSPDEVIIVADLDYTKLDKNIQSYKLSARLGRIAELETFCLITEDGDNIHTEDLLGCITIETT